MARFPLPFIPTQNYRYGGIRFGASRSGGDRTHAACDLIAKPGTPVFAVEWGIVLKVPKTPFMKNSKLFSVIVEHSSFIARYCEIDLPDPVSIHEGMYVDEGQLISYVAKNNKGGGMLHFEMYAKTGSGNLSQENNKKYLYVPAGNYKRRKDLLNPTEYLDRWSLWTGFGE